MKKIFVITFVVLTSLLIGCAGPKYTASAINSDYLNHSIPVVIIKDDKTREGFHSAMASWLDKNQYVYTTAKDGSQHDLNKLTLKYEGHWGWDLAIYLNDAYIAAFQNGQRIGKVKFRAPNSLNGSKFGNAAERIEHMMSVLFGQISAEQASNLVN